ncbi:helix-turn-helix domain-containing protein [Nocardia puris]|uniref:helix-turn-helix domain-containing protein n=1 Tax=Nocardia puris TaxID=208602 RepID=UPI002E24027A
MPGKSGTGPESIERRRRMAKALALREGGASYRRIAEALDVSLSTAHAYVVEAMAEVTKEAAESVLQLELARLDRMMLGIWRDAANGELKSIHAALKIMERRAKLTGLDALAVMRIRADGRELSAVDEFHAEMLGDKADDDEPDDDEVDL